MALMYVKWIHTYYTTYGGGVPPNSWGHSNCGYSASNAATSLGSISPLGPSSFTSAIRVIML